MKIFFALCLVFVFCSTAQAGQLSHKDAEHFVEAMQLTPEYQERFYGTAEPGFDDLVDLFALKKKMMFERSNVRGITNSQEIVYLSHVDGTYTVIAPMHSVLIWLGIQQDTGINLFDLN